jgi:hypothetical protein
MRRILLAGLALALTGPALADQRFEARLAGLAVLPAATFVAPPAGAPPGFGTSGRFTGPGNIRVEQRGAIASDTGASQGRRPTGLSLPFEGQPIQGFSGIRLAGGGAYWVTQDNGFGNKRNSSDALLMFHRIRPDFSAGPQGGTVAVERTVFLSDPNRVLPFPIVTDPSPTRFLSGADLDIESIEPMPDGTFWFGDEFGPFLFHADAEGRVLRLADTRLGDEMIRGPDNPALQVPATPTAGVAFRARRSGGFEGISATPDGARIWALIEQPLFRPGSDQPEGDFLRLLEFDPARAAWTGRHLRYRLEPGATAIGDMHFIDERRALVIERDNGEGDPALACAAGTAPTAAAPCFPAPARFKRIYLIDLGAADAEGYVRKLGHVDLMAIQDPENLSRGRGANGRFTFPFFTIENVAMVDADTIIVGNDNNLPFSAGRAATRADDNELILLRVPELLRAR